jgi:Cu+-exporting ATPase
VDKTGTLTEGRPQVTDVVAVAGVERGQVLAVAASLEAGSTHPLARAIVAAANAERVAIAAVQAFVSAPGQGASGRPEGMTGKARVGSLRFVGVGGIAFPDELIAPLRSGGKTIVAVALGDRALGVIALADRVRPTSRQAIERLKSTGIDVVMLTGDTLESARAVASDVGIVDFRAGVMPADKASAVNALKAKGVVTGMVGDGINDAPALAAAHVSFALGAGADVAVQAADITVVRNDLNAVVDAILLSRATLSKIRQNLFFAFAYNVLGIPLAAFGLLSPVIAGAAMAASSVSVVSNALLLRRWRPRDIAQRQSSA